MTGKVRIEVEDHLTIEIPSGRAQWLVITGTTSGTVYTDCVDYFDDVEDAQDFYEVLK